MMLQHAREEMKGMATTPAASHLFKVSNKDPQFLGAEKKKIFVVGEGCKLQWIIEAKTGVTEIH